MFYVKNLPGLERALRLLLALLALGFAIVNWGSSTLALGAAIAGAVLAVTALVGFCPMCAMLGRKLDRKG